MATAIINSQMDAINESFEKISSDLTTIRPLLKNAAIGAYPTDTASGSIASFTDGADDVPVKSLSVDLEPVQNLNGQSSPWPAGGGKNKFPTATATSSGAINIFNNTALSAPSGTYTLSFTSNSARTRAMSLSFELADNTSVEFSIPSTDSGATFTANAAIVKVTWYVREATDIKDIQLESGSTRTSFAPYENICPISGHDSVNVYRTGVNVWDEEWEVGAYNSLGAKSTAATSIRNVNHIRVLPNTGYYFCVPTQVTNIRKVWRDANGDFISYANNRKLSVTSPSEAYYLDVAFMDNGATYNNDISINYPSTDHDYHAYAGQTYNFSLGQTVYGGTLDVVSGLLTVDMLNVDLAALNWTYRNASKFSASLPQAANVAINVEGHLCSCMPIMYAAGVAGTNDGYFAFYKTSSTISTTTIYVNLAAEGITSVDALNEWFASHNAQLVYELATPTTVQLTATQVSTLLGANNIWADAGTVEVTYRANTELYIDKKLAQAINA